MTREEELRLIARVLGGERDAFEPLVLEHQKKIYNLTYRMTGSSSLHVHAVASSQEALETFIRTELDRLPGVIRLNSHVILSRIKDVKGLRL